MTSKPQARPNPGLFLETLNAYQRTSALKAAIELDVFTAIGEGADTPAALARRCRATERGVRILCDYLAIIGFLVKTDGRYALTLDSSVYLDRRSRHCLASAAGFLTLPETVSAFTHLATAIREGHAALPGEGSVSRENPIWVEFARSMAPLQHSPAGEIAEILDARAGKKWKALDIAAGHGVFGITLAQENPHAEIHAQDWRPVLEVAMENARAAGVAERVHLLPGDAFEVDFGTGYDVILITNFLHHYDPPTNERLLRKVCAALAPTGTVVTLDFVPNEDRVTPPGAAEFSMMMLGMTPVGDAYTFAEYQRMFQNAGFSSNEHRRLRHGDHSVILSRK